MELGPEDWSDGEMPGPDDMLRRCGISLPNVYKHAPPAEIPGFLGCTSGPAWSSSRLLLNVTLQRT